MTKKIVSLLMVFVLVLALTACTTSTEAPADEPSAAATAAPEAQEPAAEDPAAETPAAETGSPAKPVPEEGAVLHFMHIYPEHANAIEKSLEIIQRDNPGMEINVSVVPWNEATKSIQTAAATDEMYDIFFQWSSQVPGYNDIGLLLDLTPYVDDEWRSWYINDAALEEYSDDGKVLGMPLRGTAVFVIYNVDMFEENGWEIPTTQEELVALCDTILETGLIPISAPGTPNGFQVESIRGRVFDNIVYMNGLIEDPERLTDRKTEWNGLYAESAEIVKGWYQKGYFGENAFGLGREEGQTIFVTEDSAMLLCNNNELVALRELNEAANNFEIGSFSWPAPAASDRAMFTAAGFGDGWGAWSGTKYPQACAAFFRSLAGQEAMTIWANEELCIVPSNQVEYADPVQGAFAAQYEDGGYKVVADYNTGNKGDLTGQAFVDYCLSDTMTADELETQVEEITARTIADAEE